MCASLLAPVTLGGLSWGCLHLLLGCGVAGCGQCAADESELIFDRSYYAFALKVQGAPPTAVARPPVYRLGPDVV